MKIKLRRAQLQIDLSAIEENWRRLSRLVRPGVRIAAVLKSDAYGLGLLPVGALLSRLGCRDFVVGTIEEAEVLRKVAPSQSIQVLYADMDRDLRNFSAMQIIPVINDERGFRYWLQHYPRLSATLRVDTGLSTFGIDWREVPGLWARYAKSDTSLTTLMSHLAAENKADIEKSLEQKMRFDQVCRHICAKEKSLAASGGALLGPAFHYDLVRSGLYLLGFEVDSDKPDITVPAVTLDAPIIAIRDVRKGESIGYDLDCKAHKNLRIAVAFLGLSHGMWIPRSVQVRAQIGQWEIPSIGRVELEKTIFDVSDVPMEELYHGSAVRLIGGPTKIENLARSIGAHPNELLCRFSHSITRNYVASGAHVGSNKL
ncbi:alanine racemase [Alcaligenaceae bacterium A4P071]|nr:alanine racemase [Alcaligenaceae bacterium A4P071]